MKTQPVSYVPSQIDPTLAGQEVRYRRVSELTGSESPLPHKASGMHYYSSGYKFDTPISEMSPDSPPTELYSLQQESADHKADCMSPGTPIAELSGDERRLWGPHASGFHVGGLPHGRELPHDFCDEEYHPQVADDNFLHVPRQNADPGLQSPQIASYKSSPVSPERPAGINDPLTDHYQFPVDSSPSQGAQLYKDSVEANSALFYDWIADVTTSNLNGWTFDQSSEEFGPGFGSLVHPVAWNIDCEGDMNYQMDWSQTVPPFFQPPSQQVEEDPANHLAPVDDSLVDCSKFEQPLELEIPETQPILQRALTLPTRLPVSGKLLSQEDLQARIGTWQSTDGETWTACDPKILTKKISKARVRSSDNNLSMPSSGSHSLNRHEYLDTSDPETREENCCKVKCKGCGKPYTGQFAKGNMRRHFIQKHGHGLGKVYTCRMCDKSYHRSDARRSHERQMHRKCGAASFERRVVA